jgi:hypothetical protein
MKHSNETTPAGNLVALDDWCKNGIMRTRQTVWRWRRKGLIKCSNNAGRLYIGRDEIARFEAMIANGELAQEPSGCAAKSIEQPQAA